MRHTQRSAALPGGDAADLAGKAERARGVDGHSGQRLLRRQAEQGARHVHRQGRRQHRRGAGVAVGGDGDRHLVLAQQRDRRLLLLLQRVEGARQQHGDGPGRGHRLGAGFVEMFEMVGRQRAILRGERGAVLVRQLLGVEPDAQAVVRGGLEQALDLLRGEGDGVAKGVDAGGKAGLGGSRDQLVDDLRHIMRAAVALVGRQRMQREQGAERCAPPRLRRAGLASLSSRISALGSRP